MTAGLFNHAPVPNYADRSQIRRQTIRISRTKACVIESDPNLPGNLCRYRGRDMADAWYAAGLVVESEGRITTLEMDGTNHE
jgi:hypothetical protein